MLTHFVDRLLKIVFLRVCNDLNRLCNQQSPANREPNCLRMLFFCHFTSMGARGFWTEEYTSFDEIIHPMVEYDTAVHY